MPYILGFFFISGLDILIFFVRSVALGADFASVMKNVHRTSVLYMNGSFTSFTRDETE
jgi:hypothetical protein